MREVVVTGIGLVAPGAANPAALAELFARARPAMRSLGQLPGGPWHGGVADADDLEQGLSRAELANLDRTSLLALRAAGQSLDDAGLVGDEALTQAGVYLGCGGGGLLSLEDNLRQMVARGDVRSTCLLRTMANAPTAQLSIRWGLLGPSYTYAVACASSAIAIGEAWRAIACGDADIMLAGGTETPLGEISVKGWAAMRVMARSDQADHPPTCAPFCADRSGMMLGEGAAIFVLEEAGRARRRGARIHARLLGYGAASDASHITAPHPDGQARAIRAALRSAGVPLDEVGYVNAHGTATANGDASECQALQQVFGHRLADIPVSSTKSFHGHLIGAAGALELVPAILAVRDGFIAPTLNFQRPDPACPIDCVPNTPRERPGTRVALSNSFSFGGSNACLVVGSDRC